MMHQVGIFGAGNLARAHGSAISASGSARVKALYSASDGAADCASDLKAGCASSPGELLDDNEIASVVIASAPEERANLLKLAREAGKHILCEMPIVPGEAELAEIEGRGPGRNKLLAVSELLRFTPEYQYLRQAVQNGLLGTIGTIRLGHCSSLAHLDESAGDALLDPGAHDVDVARWIFGEFDHVCAMHTTNSRLKDSDYGLLVGRLKSGAIVHIEASLLEAQDESYNYFEVTGSDGMLEFDSRKEPLFKVEFKAKIATSGPRTQIFIPRPVSPYDAQIAHFFSAIEEGREPVLPIHDAMKTMRVVFAAQTSANGAGVVQL